MTLSRRLLIARRALLASACVLTPTLPAHAQSLAYSLIPSAQRIRWDDLVAFEEDWMYGGRLALQFGKLVELQPFYFVRNNYPIEAARATSVFGPAATGRTVDIDQYGATLQLNLGTGSLVPFVRGGGGILRFSPDSGEKVERIAITAGGGLRFGIGGLKAEVFAEQMAFRLNPRGLFARDTGGTETLRNLSYGAALTLPLSQLDSDDPVEGLRGTTAPIEPFVGKMRYAGNAGLRDQELAGIRAGIDFSAMVGVRGFYWRGVNEDRDGTDPVAAYGGEAQFNLNAGTGISPYVVAGAGRILYFGGFRDLAGNPREDVNALIVGAGASVRLGDRVGLNVAARDYVMSEDHDVGAVASTDDLMHNTLISAGFTFRVGGSSGPTDAQRARDRELRELRATRDRDLARVRDEAVAQRDAAGRANDRMPRSGPPAARRNPRAAADSSAAGRTTPGGDRWITIPVPTQGEVILRFGYPPRDSVRVVMPAAPAAPLPAPRPDSSGASSVDLAMRLADLERRLSDRIDAVRMPATTTVTTPAPATTVIETRADGQARQTPLLQRFGQLSSRDLRPYVGIGGGDGNAQFIASLRADLGPLSNASALRFVPEFAVGMGEGSTTVLALANLQYSLGSLMGSSTIRPYITGGVGVFSPSVLGVNTAVGTTIDLRPRAGSPLFAYAELQGLNLFDHTRVLVGLGTRR